MKAMGRWLLMIGSGLFLLGIHLFYFAILGSDSAQAQGASAAEEQSAAAIVGSLQITDSTPASASAYHLNFSALTPPPVGSHYELWLTATETEPLDLGVITVTNGQVNLQGETTQNLLAYGQAVISIEADDDTNAAISDQIVFSSTLPPQLLTALQPLLWQTAAGEKGALHGAYEQMQIVVQHTGFLRDALVSNDLPKALRHTEHMINILDGEDGLRFSDYDGDGQAQNPGDGVGVSIYLEGAFTRTQALIETVAQLQLEGAEGLETAAEATQTGQARILVAFDKALKIFSADTVTEAQKLADDLAITINTLNSEVTQAYTTMLQRAEYQFTASAPVGETQGASAAEEQSAAAIVGSLQITDSTPASVSGYRLSFSALTPPPVGSHYELWLTATEAEPLDLGVITVTNGQVNLQGETTQNLLAYGQAVISLEADGDTNAAISDQIVFSSTLPPQLLAALQPLLWQTAAGEKGALHGAYEQMQIVVQHTGFLRDALVSNDLPKALRHTEHMINILDGEDGLRFSDYDGDGQAQNPGDGVGVSIYLEGVIETVAQLQLEGAEGLETAAEATQTGQALILVAFDKALKIFSADTVTEAQKSADDLAVTINTLNSEVTQTYTTMLQRAEYQFTASAPSLGKVKTIPTPTPTQTPTVASMQTQPLHNAGKSERWQNPVDGAMYVHIKGAEFAMGSTKETAASVREQPQHNVQVADFWLQETETTNAQYARCVEAGACTPPANQRWQDPTFADHPVTDVDWQQANTYAQWAGGRLPTEAEWERACRGDDGRAYPWGDGAPTAERANFNNSTGDVLPVGSLPAGASPYGALDMSGNVWEWTSSLDANYPYDATDGREDADAAGKRIVRGGSFYYTQYQIRCAARTGFAPDSVQPQLGLRVAMTQPASEWRNPVDGALYVYVEGGEFMLGSTKTTAASPREEPQHKVQVESFWLQQTETTNAQYARCVEAGACTPPANQRWQDSAFADHPVTDVNWQQANAYSQWAGGRLPTEAEWERACRGEDGRAYPWGNEAPTPDLANFNNSTGDTLPVGSLPAGAGPFGALDMSGNVWEWTSTIDANYPYDASDGREDANATGKRIVRGGSFYYTQYQIRCAARTGFTPDSVQPQFGFRVVITKTR